MDLRYPQVRIQKTLLAEFFFEKKITYTLTLNMVNTLRLICE